MGFNSLVFIFILLPFALLVYKYIPKQWHNIFLLILSLFFYLLKIFIFFFQLVNSFLKFFILLIGIFKRILGTYISKKYYCIISFFYCLKIVIKYIAL